MRYVFIVNPKAGKTNAYDAVFPKIHAYLQESGLDYTCRVTERPGHAADLAREEAAAGGQVRIYTVGGDGTLSEAASGVAGIENVELGVFPCGSGDDYVKIFGGRGRFLNIAKQITAPSRPMDLIRSDQKVSINVCSIGLDADVAYRMKHFKTIPFVPGPMAYDLALAQTLCGKLGKELRITIDDEQEYKGSFLFAVAGCGQYYGGGYRAAPRAVPDDGLLDFIFVRTPKLRQVPPLVGVYKAGNHLDDPRFSQLMTFVRGKKMVVQAEKPVVGNFDGECYTLQTAVFEVLPHAIRFIVPEE